MNHGLLQRIGMTVVGAVLSLGVGYTQNGDPRGTRTVDAERLRDAASDEANWLTHGRDYGEQRYSPLDLVNVGNVANLRLAWFHDLDTNRAQEATPLIVDGVMYSTSAWSKIQALNAATGKLLWQFDPQVPRTTGGKACCDVVNRGVAFWRGTVFIGSLDGRLIAVDVVTGRPKWSVMTVDPSQPYTITGAPRVVKGKVIIGNGGAEFGVRGYVTAYDAETGALAWRFYTVPGDPSKPFEQPILAQAAKTWTGEWWRLGGGGTVWDSMAYDPELDLLYIGVGNGSPWNQGVRSPGGGDNLFLSSIIALHPDDGSYAWHYQTTPGESWDYTATQSIILANLRIDGVERRVLMQAPKNGFFYVLDRATGELLSVDNYVPVTWAEGIDRKSGRPIENPNARYYKTGKAWLAQPSPFGGHNWHPMAYSPKSGLVYLPAQEIGFAYVPDTEFSVTRLSANLGLDLATGSLPQDPAIKKAIMAATRGHLAAWDPIAHREIWRVQYSSPWNGGVLATGGDLVFQGTTRGEIRAYEATSGRSLWSFDAHTGVVAPPVTYRIGSEQYIAVVTGWGGAFPNIAGELSWVSGKPRNRSRILAFKLGGTAVLPDETANLSLPSPPPLIASEGTVTRGKKVYHRYCMFCHGDAGVSGGVLPDLRYSPLLHSAGGWSAVVRNGALESRGMIGFGTEISETDAEAIRAYVILRAHESAAPTHPTPPP